MDRQVTRRYARALAEEAGRQGHLGQVDEDVNLLRESLGASPALGRMFRSPVVPRKKKEAVAERLIKPRVGGLTYRFVELLIQKDREEQLEGMLDAYRALRDRQEGISEATVRTARPLSDEERTRLEEAISRMTGQPTVRLDVTRHPDLIGGVIVRVGDTVYDGSVRHQLASLHERLARRADVSDALGSEGSAATEAS